MEIAISTLVLAQAIGAILGAGGSVMAEIFYIQAIRDGRIDHAEQDHLRIVGRTLRIGMITILISSIGLGIVDFSYNLYPQPALSSAYWTLMLLVLVIIISTWAVARRRISFTIGSAAIFTAWWQIAFLTLGKLPPMSFGASIALYIVATVLMAGVLMYARMMVTRRA